MEDYKVKFCWNCDLEMEMELNIVEDLLTETISGDYTIYNVLILYPTCLCLVIFH